MFENCIDLHYNCYQQVGFSIVPYINRAINVSMGNRCIATSIEELDSLKLNHRKFTRINLVEIWRNENISFTTKILTTFWWGGISHQYQAPIFYRANNLDNFSSISTELKKSLEELLLSPDEGSFNKSFGIIYEKLSKGKYKINGINTSFFTKIFQFYFESNPIRLIDFPHPIIADQWSLKAIYAEMISQNYDGNEIFKTSFLNGNNKLYVNFRPDRNEFDSYLKFIQFFNCRVNDLRKSYHNLTPFRLEEILFGWARDLNNPENPRFIAENIIRNHLNLNLL